ncbi:hypothetical protein SLV14_004218 [Streptomyces sp. Je 1-4]|uniref:YqeB family protein n=1 Tax=Streptomyces TaxID=1883 RepID=UPI0021DB106B|nr:MULTISPECIES: hypothetical protein [unclassified Streptomyces]UYB41475.1 hypothetical protein SLV14_004218 [Streptomyces sp. Je 1-4]UZQ37712.1 hypothetical protein SLV14N_004218 [Streptomyces sp. Je 1-4] [Streptomyces sp. Je 1-4 4N24]UZQ45129.1 hypothetical protein SLV14NA_004218 [Streptomyces sp. Je 1-4] [Streptomyces sp. Je 1-4 4N24_ara]
MTRGAGLEPDLPGDRLTVLGQQTWGAAGVYLGLAVLGAGAGWLVGFLADWLSTCPWPPLQVPAQLLAWLPAPVLPVVGSVAGLALGFIGQREQLVIRLSDQCVTLLRKGREHEFPYDAVARVFRDGKQLVLLGHDGGELARQECDLEARRVADAFTGHGYAWADADPYEDMFRRWVPGTPGLPKGADAVLKARQEALEKKDSSDDDIGELREELARLGVVVKEEKRRQYWRRTRLSEAAAE